MTAGIATGAAITSAVTIVADKASSANAYFTGGAALCGILTFIGVPLWRALRKATTERRHQTALLTAMYGAVFGTPRRMENGVVVEEAANGVVTKLDESTATTNTRLAQHDEQIAAARKTAGEAAVIAAALAERVTMLNERWWEWMESLQARNNAHEAVLHELGMEITPLPRPPADRTDSAELHDP